MSFLYSIVYSTQLLQFLLVMSRSRPALSTPKSPITNITNTANGEFILLHSGRRRRKAFNKFRRFKPQERYT